MYDDEYCGEGGICAVDYSLYDNFKCPDQNAGSSKGDKPSRVKEEKCDKKLKPYCGPKTKDIRRCKSTDCECKYDDEYCDHKSGLCRVAEDLYKYF